MKTDHKHTQKTKPTACQFAMLTAAIAFGGTIITGTGILPRIALMRRLSAVMLSCLSQTDGSSGLSLITEPATLIAIAALGCGGGLLMALLNRLIRIFDRPKETASA